MKNKIITIFLSLILLMLVSSLKIVNVDAATEDKINLKVNVGYDSTYKIGSPVPVNMEIENNLKNINGELQIEVENTRSDVVNNITLYSQSINLPVNSTKKITMNVPMFQYVTKLQINIVEGKNTVFQKEVVIPGGMSGENILIGILSDDFDSLSYINQAVLNKNMNFSVKNTKLSQNNLPEDLDAMKMFNIIVVDNFDTSKLTEKQYATLKNWVNEGGLLLIGTGDTYSKTLSGFKDDFLSIKSDGTMNLSTRALYNLAGDSAATPMKINVLKNKINNGTSVISENGIDLVQKVEKGKGTIALAAFDFGLNPISDWQLKSVFVNKLFEQTAPKIYTSNRHRSGNIMNDEGRINLNNIAELSVPSATKMAILFLVYIVLVSLINYVILKKIDRRELMWITVPVLSIIFAIIMYGSGAATRINKPIANVLSFVNIDDSGNIDTDTYAAVFSNQKGDMKVEGAGDTTIKPVLNNNYYGGQNPQSAKSVSKNIQQKITLAPKLSIEFYKLGVFSSKTIAIDSNGTAKGSIECNLNYINSNFKGTIKNNSGFDIDEAYVVDNGIYIAVGSLKNGESKNIDEAVKTFRRGEWYNFTEAIYKPVYSTGRSIQSYSDKEIQKFREEDQKRQIMSQYLEEEYGTEGTKLLAWSKTPISKDILVNGKDVKKYEKNFITAPVKLTYRDGNNVEYPVGYVKPEISFKNPNNSNVDNSKYNFDQNERLYMQGTYEIKFSIDKDINLQNVGIKYSLGNQSSGGNPPKQYIWDNETNDWKEGDYTSFNIEGNDLSKYINKDNELKLKIEVTETRGNQPEVPSISVKGSVK